MKLVCIKCKTPLMHYFIGKDGLCNGCRNPHLIVVAEEVMRLRHLIECDPADVKLLKKEYKQLTGKAYRRKK